MPKNTPHVTYCIYKFGKFVKAYRTKAALLKAIDRLPPAKLKGLKLKTHVKFSLAK